VHHEQRVAVRGAVDRLAYTTWKVMSQISDTPKNLPLKSKAYENGSAKPFCELLSQIQGVTANLPSRVA
jgi:hypothetical protein